MVIILPFSLCPECFITVSLSFLCPSVFIIFMSILFTFSCSVFFSPLSISFFVSLPFFFFSFSSPLFPSICFTFSLPVSLPFFFFSLFSPLSFYLLHFFAPCLSPFLLFLLLFSPLFFYLFQFFAPCLSQLSFYLYPFLFPCLHLCPSDCTHLCPCLYICPFLYPSAFHCFPSHFDYVFFLLHLHLGVCSLSLVLAFSLYIYPPWCLPSWYPGFYPCLGLCVYSSLVCFLSLSVFLSLSLHLDQGLCVCDPEILHPCVSWAPLLVWIFFCSPRCVPDKAMTFYGLCF